MTFLPSYKINSDTRFKLHQLTSDILLKKGVYLHTDLFKT